jgi:predicted transcriptional regulator
MMEGDSVPHDTGTSGPCAPQGLAGLVAGIVQTQLRLRNGADSAAELGEMIRTVGEALAPYYDRAADRPAAGTSVAHSAPEGDRQPAASLLSTAQAPASTERADGMEIARRTAAADDNARAPIGDERPDWMPEGTFGPQRPPWAPAVNPARTHTYELVTCLEDGRQMQMLKRHLKRVYGMTAEQYIRKWGLPEDYPMSSQKYRDERRAIATETGYQPQPAAVKPKRQRARTAA